MKDLLSYILNNILDHPDDIRIEEVVDQNNDVIYKVHVHKEDMGKVIGKEGKIIKSIRTLLKTKGIVSGRKVDLQLVEPEV